MISPTATVPTATVPTVIVEDYGDDGGSTSTFGVGLAVGVAVGVVGVIFTILFFVVIIIMVGSYIQLYINDGQRTRDFHYRNNIPYSGKFSPKPGPMYCKKNSPDLFSRCLDWAKLNSNVIYI